MKLVIKSLSTFIVYILVALIFNGEHSYMLSVFFITYFLTSFYIFSTSVTKQRDFVFLNAPFVVVLLITSIVERYFALTLTYIIFTPIISYLAYLFVVKKAKYLLAVTVLLLMFVQFFFFPNVFSFLVNKDEKTYLKMPLIILRNAKGDTVQLQQDKIYVLDFWSTSCSVCFKKFPRFNEFFKLNNGQKNTEIYAVHVPFKQDTFPQTTHILDSFNYSFPCLYAVSAEELSKKINVKLFPNYIIIKNGRVVYSGNASFDKNVLIGNLQREYDKIKE
jgi:thiol-disulfide isomerase/thioredoxin